MRAHSLRLRLLLAAAFAVLIAMLIAWFVMSWLFARHIERRVAMELENEAIILLADLKLSPGQEPQVDETPANPRFNLPSSGLYWQVSNAKGMQRSRSLWDESLPLPVPAPPLSAWRTRSIDGPFGQRLFLLERSISLSADSPPILLQLAQDKALQYVARKEFGRDLGLFLAVLGAVLLAAAALQVSVGLKPLRKLRYELLNLQHHPASRLTDTHPREITPLIDAINRLADAREADLTRAKRRAADLAHSLKTPLAALEAQSNRARAAGASEAADGIEHAISAMTAAVNAELGRLRVDTVRNNLYSSASSAQEAAEQIVGVIEHTAIGESLVFNIDIPASLRVPVPLDDLKELLGALLENAARFARRQVSIRGQMAADNKVELLIEDDGLGLDAATLYTLQHRGKLDEAGPGHQGLGLIIARELVEATNGQIQLTHSTLGGLKIVLTWPAALRAD
ncbi:sensor histidine kinase [Herminiimonas sp. KBW02]|uniref:sensor histidine kinase n=1 Tax=Herminiimonas sp. KBW02 TaxID=2153363 RepID=UPI000F5A9144|nr:HAMP domain-containing sensor histidine kinase [Herminiimonas sp. KBW02]RQO38449.1 sensor histidine kinase [Herminiimonas sp. KBW02]